MEAHTRKLCTGGVGIGDRRYTPRQQLYILRDVGSREGLIATGVTQGDISNASAGSRTPKGTIKQTTLHMWGTTPTPNIINLKTSTRILDLEDGNLIKEEKVSQIRQNRATKVQVASHVSVSSRTPRQHLGAKVKDTVSLKHIHLHGINFHHIFVEFSNAMSILDTIEAGIYSVLEAQWDITCLQFFKMIR